MIKFNKLKNTLVILFSLIAIQLAAQTYFVGAVNGVPGSGINLNETDPIALTYPLGDIVNKQNILIGNEGVFNNWDKNALDDFDGVFNSLSGRPTITLSGGNVTGTINLQALTANLTANITGGVSSVFGRTGAVVAQAGDYNAFYEPIITTKNTAFNKNFGTSAGTVLEGNTTTISTAQANAITANTAKVSANGSVVTHSDITSAGSGIIISTGERSKLTGISAGAEVNVQPDWNQLDNTADDFVKNKPTTITTDQANAIVTNTAKVGITTTQANAINANSAKVSADGSVTTHSDVTNAGSGAIITNTERSAIATNSAKVGITTTQANAITTNSSKNSYPSADATKLAGIAANAEVNVNADWNAVSGDAQILNKPTFSNSLSMAEENKTISSARLHALNAPFQISGTSSLSLQAGQLNLTTNSAGIGGLNIVSGKGDIKIDASLGTNTIDFEGNQLSDIGLLDIRENANDGFSWQMEKIGDNLSIATGGASYLLKKDGATTTNDVLTYPSGGTTNQVIAKDINGNLYWKTDAGATSFSILTEGDIGGTGSLNSGQKLAIESDNTGLISFEMIVSGGTPGGVNYAAIINEDNFASDVQSRTDLDDLSEGATNKHFTAVEKTKLASLSNMSVSFVTNLDLANGGGVFVKSDLTSCLVINTGSTHDKIVFICQNGTGCGFNLQTGAADFVIGSTSYDSPATIPVNNGQSFTAHLAPDGKYYGYYN